MIIITDSTQLQQKCTQLRSEGKKIGFVPTMGFLHEGHLSLMKQCRKLCDILVVSIYVNPLQFGPNEDLDRYPRDLDGDLQKCNDQHVDIVFTPSEMYHPTHSCYVNVENLDKHLCGASREGHFQGVTTVVARLFGLVQPNIAVFGEKDYQQLAIIRRMVRDLAMPIEILSGTIVREPTGLALSSRNRYLNPKEHEQAQTLSKSLFWARDFCIQQSSPVNSKILIKEIISRIAPQNIDYVSIVDVDTLQPLDEITKQARVALAIWVGKTRLIDNMHLQIGTHTGDIQ